jgi:predicted HD phosphohydrolase
MHLNSMNDAFDLLATRGDGAYGLTSVTQLEHALQSAALAAEQALGPAMIIAALLHDIGHMTISKDIALADANIDDQHEIAGAAMLKNLFGPDVIEPILLHVPAKRWLYAAEPSYFSRLAPDSIQSLKLQGGPMSVAEVAVFGRRPCALAAAALRRIDDDAKIPGFTAPPLETYREERGRPHSHSGSSLRNSKSAKPADQRQSPQSHHQQRAFGR